MIFKCRRSADIFQWKPFLAKNKLNKSGIKLRNPVLSMLIRKKDMPVKDGFLVSNRE